MKIYKLLISELPYVKWLFVAVFIPAISFCQIIPNLNPRWSSSALVEDLRINEASGLVASRLNHNIFWTHNDSGDSASIYAIDKDGKKRGKFTLNGIFATDIEDISIFKNPKDGLFYLLLADIGDNREVRENKKIYLFKEPKITKNSADKQIDKYQVISFQYPDNKKYDAETLLFDPFSQEIIIVTKRGKKSKDKADLAFSIPLQSINLNKIITAEFCTNIQIPTGLIFGFGTTGGDISSDGRYLLLKTYTNVYYWQRENNMSFKDFFKNQAINLPYISREGQGEAIAFSVDGAFYYTIPEATFSPAYLTAYQLYK